MTAECPKCGEESFMICGSCGYSRITGGKVEQEEEKDIVSVYRVGKNHKQQIRNKIAYYQGLLFEMKKEEKKGELVDA